jgi:hypothetical protein
MSNYNLTSSIPIPLSPSGASTPSLVTNTGANPCWINDLANAYGTRLSAGASILWDAGRPMYAYVLTGAPTSIGVLENAGNIAVPPTLSPGSVTGTALAADAIDGKVITGATLRTASPYANRVEIFNNGGIGHVDFYAGTGVGELPAALTARAVGGAVSDQYVSLKGQTNISGTAPEVALSSENAPLGGYQSRIDLTADVMWINRKPFRDGYVYDAAAGWIPRTYAGSTVRVFPAAGPSYISFGVTIAYTSKYAIVAQNGDYNAQPNMYVLGHEGLPNGPSSYLNIMYAGMAAGAARIDWSAVYLG